MSKFYTVDRSGNDIQNTSFELKKDYSRYQFWIVQDVYDEKEVIDRTNQLYPSGLSEHGINYLIREGIVIFKDGTRKPLNLTYTTPMIEAVFELVRRNEFSYLPSRMQSMFACCDLIGAQKFKSVYGSSENQIYELESENAFIADQNFLYLGGSVIGTYELARKYWSGTKSGNCRLEAVIPLPTVIGCMV